MAGWVTWKRGIAAIVVLGCLAGSHWSMYWLGTRHQSDKTSAFLQSFDEECAQENLRIRVQAMRLMAKHPQQYSPEEVSFFCLHTNAVADSVERRVVVPARQAENDPVANRWGREVEEARKLSALLRREKR